MKKGYDEDLTARGRLEIFPDSGKHFPIEELPQKGGVSGGLKTDAGGIHMCITHLYTSSISFCRFFS